MTREEALALPPGNPIRVALERDLVARPTAALVPAGAAPSRDARMTPEQWAAGMVVRSRGPRPGAETETLLYRQLLDAGAIDVLGARHHPDIGTEWLFVPQFAWGWYLVPQRGFQSDFAFPAARLLVEIDGGAHAAGRAKVARDIERRGLAATLGCRICSVTPAQVRAKEAAEIVVRALLG